MQGNKSKNQRKSRRGRPPNHGGYSFLVKGELPENRSYIKQYLTAVREGLIQDLGPAEKDLTTAQLILIDRIVVKLGVVRCIEEHVRVNGVMKGERLSPSLSESYISYNNSIRLSLQALGINKQQKETILTPYEIVDEEGNGEQKTNK